MAVGGQGSGPAIVSSSIASHTSGITLSVTLKIDCNSYFISLQSSISCLIVQDRLHLCQQVILLSLIYIRICFTLHVCL